MDDLFIGLSSLPLRLALLACGIVLVCRIARSVGPALAAGLAVGIAYLSTMGLKELIDRPRPSDTDPLVPMPDSPSFPSGHASTAFAAAAALAVFVRVPSLRVAMLLVAGAVAYSRIRLGVHDWSDILAGALLGAVIGWTVARGLRNRGHVAAIDLDRSPGEVRGSGREHERGNPT